MLTHTWMPRHFTEVALSLLEHAAVMAVGFVLMVVGLGMGVTMVLLPFGIVIGLVGVLLFVSGLLVRGMDRT